MSAYCTNCGTPLNGPFCANCGQRAPITGAPMPSGPAEAVPARSPVAKYVVIGLGLALVLLVLGVGGVAYGVHWIKGKAMSRYYSYTGRSVYGKACELLPREELEQVLGVAVERTAEIGRGSEAGCAYYTNPRAFDDLRRMAVEQGRHDSEAASAKATEFDKSGNPLELLKHTNELEGVVKAFGLLQPDKNGQVFAFTVHPSFGRRHWPALRSAMSLVPGFEETTGVGDSAMIGSFGHALLILKGDSMVRLELMYVPEARTRGAELGRKIAARL